MKNVQIPLTLFLELYGYVVLGEYQFHDDIVRQLEGSSLFPRGF